WYGDRSRERPGARGTGKERRVMRFVSRKTRRGAGELAGAILWGALALTPLSARAGQAPVMPMVLPQQSLPYLQQLNGSTGFTVVCLSQAPDANTGGMTP